MQISSSLGMSIVTEVKKIIHEDLTFMDKSCRIIACTDERRIGDFHEASRKMLDEGLKELTVPDDDTYQGTRSGINLTLELEGQVVGVVGITGNEEEVSRYGQVVKKMTEILLLESYLKEEKIRERSARNRFLQEWLMTDELRMNPALVDEGISQGIDVMAARRAAVLEHTGNSIMSQEDVERIEHRIHRILKEDMRNVSGSSGGNFIVLMSERSDEMAAKLIAQIQKDVLKECGYQLIAGVDSRTVSGGQLKAGYLRAIKAMNGAAVQGNGGIAFYDSILLEIFINDIGQATKEEFIQRVFKGCSEKRMKEAVRILRVLYECDGSINQAAEQLYLHKNTLQYKLNRLREKTGYDPRKLSSAPYYYLAIAFYESME